MNTQSRSLLIYLSCMVAIILLGCERRYVQHDLPMTVDGMTFEVVEIKALAADPVSGMVSAVCLGYPEDSTGSTPHLLYYEFDDSTNSYEGTIVDEVPAFTFIYRLGFPLAPAVPPVTRVTADLGFAINSAGEPAIFLGEAWRPPSGEEVTLSYTTYVRQPDASSGGTQSWSSDTQSTVLGRMESEGGGHDFEHLSVSCDGTFTYYEDAGEIIEVPVVAYGYYAVTRTSPPATNKLRQTTRIGFKIGAGASTNLLSDSTTVYFNTNTIPSHGWTDDYSPIVHAAVDKDPAIFSSEDRLNILYRFGVSYFYSDRHYRNPEFPHYLLTTEEGLSALSNRKSGLSMLHLSSEMPGRSIPYVSLRQSHGVVCGFVTEYSSGYEFHSGLVVGDDGSEPPFHADIPSQTIGLAGGIVGAIPRVLVSASTKPFVATHSRQEWLKDSVQPDDGDFGNPDFKPTHIAMSPGVWTGESDQSDENTRSGVGFVFVGGYVGPEILYDPVIMQEVNRPAFPWSN